MARLFLIPGMNHCMGGTGDRPVRRPDRSQKWVEQGEAPQSIMATGAAFPGRTRPLCPYPQYASYNGSGDPQEGKNFTCKNPAVTPAWGR